MDGVVDGAISLAKVRQVYRETIDFVLEEVADL